MANFPQSFEPVNSDSILKQFLQLKGNVNRVNEAMIEVEETADSALEKATSNETSIQIIENDVQTLSTGLETAEQNLAKCVRFDEQSLTDAQKAQARSNIGAGSAMATTVLVNGQAQSQIQFESDPQEQITNVSSDIDTLGQQIVDDQHYLYNLSNPNLLINGDFRINQRGQNSYTGTGYTVDRWRMSGNGTFDVLNKSLISVGAAYIGIVQSIENWEALKGKTITASIKATSGAVGIRFGFKTGNTDLKYVDGLIDSTGTLSVTFTIPNDADYTNLNVAVWNKGEETTTYEYVKLEVGSVATPFRLRPYAEELTLCQRYYQVYNQLGLSGNSAAVGFAATSFIFKTEMRVSPTIIHLNPVTIRISGANYTQSSATDNAHWISNKGVTMSLNNFSNNPTGYFNSITDLDVLAFDAEIY